MTSDSAFILPEEAASRWTGIALIEARPHSVLYCAKRYGRRYILKTVPPDKQSLTEYRTLQEREFQTGFSLRHPNIVETYSMEEVPDIGTCIVIEYVDGMTLAEWLGSSPKYAARLRIWRQLSDVLDYLRSRQMEHHDLKADNILITSDERYLKLIDFGLSGVEQGRSDAQAAQHLLRLLFPRPLQRLWVRYSHLLRWVPLCISVLVLLLAGFLFHNARLDRQTQLAEQARREQAIEEVNRLWEMQEAEMLPMVARSDIWMDFTAQWEAAKGYYVFQNPALDSLINTFPADDPFGYVLQEIWDQRYKEAKDRFMRAIYIKK